MNYKNPATPYLVLLILCLIWGSSFILMKRGLEFFSPIQVAALRLSLGGLVLLPTALKNVRKEPVGNWKYFAIVGLLGNGFPAFLFTVAQTHLSSSVTGVLNAMTPLFTLLVGIWFYGNVFKRDKVWGILISLIGAIILILLKGNGKMESDFRYGLLVLLAPLMYAFSVNTVKNHLPKTAPLVIAALPITAVMIPCLGLLAYSGFFSLMMEGGEAFWRALGFVSILGIFGTAISLILFNKLIQETNAVFASSVTYLIPLVALMWGWLDGEEVGVWQLFGMVLVLIGVYIVNRNVSEAK